MKPPYTDSRPDEPQLVRAGFFVRPHSSAARTLLYWTMYDPLYIIGAQV